MNNPPAFQFYPQDFLSDLNVQSMTMEERGVYITLLCHCWIEDGLKNGIPLVDHWLKNATSLARCFVKKGDKYRNPRLDRERDKQKAWVEKSKKGGLKSAENKRDIKNGATKGEPRANQRRTKGQLFSLQSSSSIKNKSRDLYIDDDFNKFWEAYPNKEGKRDALEAFQTLRKKESLETIAKAFNGYMAFLKHERIKNNFDRRPKNAATFLRKERWREYLDFIYKPPL